MKKKKENNNRQKSILTYVLIGGGLLLILEYFYVFQRFNDEAESLQRSNKALQEQVNIYKDYYEHETEYQQSIESMRKQIDDMLKEFPADVKEENVVKLALDTLDNAEIRYTTINIADKEAVKTIPAETVSPAGFEDLNDMIIFIKKDASFVNKLDYFNLKDVVKTINDNKERSTISSILYTKNDSENCLEGTIEVSFFSAVGTGAEYKEVKLPKYVSGVEDLFNLKTEEELAAEEAAEETEEAE